MTGKHMKINLQFEKFFPVENLLSESNKDVKFLVLTHDSIEWKLFRVLYRDHPNVTVTYYTHDLVNLFTENAIIFLVRPSMADLRHIVKEIFPNLTEDNQSKECICIFEL